MLKKIELLILLLGVFATVFLAGYLVFGWVEPSQTPPGGNVSAPINVGGNEQWKIGTIGVGYNAPQFGTSPGSLVASAFYDAEPVGTDYYGINPSSNSVSALFRSNVGIGMGSSLSYLPVAKLQISGNINNYYSRPLYVQMDAAGSEPTLHTAAFANAAGYGIALGAYDGDDGSTTAKSIGSISAYKFTNGFGNTHVNLILQREGGNVGIGTVSPVAKLHVARDDLAKEVSIGDDIWTLNDDTTRLTMGSTNKNSFIRIGQSGSNYGSIGWTYSSTGSNGYLKIQTTGSNKGIIMQSDGGNVGIGTTSPTNKLHVYTSSLGERPILATAYDSVTLQTVSVGLGGVFSTTPISRTAVLDTLDTADFSILTNGSSYGYYFTGGKLGIRVTPTETLDLGGGNIKMGYEVVSNQCTASASCSATCSAGKKVIGGGCYTNQYSSSQIGASYPSGDTSWQCYYNGSFSGSNYTKAHVICANIR